MSEATDVLHAIDQLRRDLSGYHGQLKAHNDLQRHCDNQRKRIVELEGLYAKAKAERDETAMAFSKEHDRAEFLMRENAKLREICASLFRLANNECLSGKRHCDDCLMSRNEPPCVLSLDFIAMLELGIDVTPWDVERIEVDNA